MKKVAVRCLTLELFNKVAYKIEIETGRTALREDIWGKYKDTTCIDPSDNCYCNESWLIKEGYKIISAKEYLGKEIERELTEEAQEARDEFKVEFDNSDRCTCHCGNPPCSWCTHPGNPHNQEDDFNYKDKKGDHTMSSITIKAVIFNHKDYSKADSKLVQDYCGGLIPDDFNGALALEDHGEEYLAEAKRLKEAEDKETTKA